MRESVQSASNRTRHLISLQETPAALPPPFDVGGQAW
jgi:hypothetical protein